ncbi:peptide chain release factor N(5)-glutamine methyltransferase [Pseudidiomarina andamanensis]|uniref:Release factor glutamine methyltransferase n=2 Tax=Pseudidiomarina andamanensis TaxID=1940690 RepID=A0AA92EPN4_9GAMM|nr:peptide chain release factor N(5)-glutamine methyltransferase [Pseudidiomarina andamanensis]
MTLAEALRWATQQLTNSESAKLDAEVLLAHIVERDRTYLFTWSDRLLEPSEQERFAALIQQRQQGIPIAHLVGQREFWSLPLAVNDSTLIPRPDTEVLVEHALSLPLPVESAVLDLGTGTGAIALALKSSRPKWRVMAVDKMAEAVALAKQNAATLNLAVDVKQSDWFAAIEAQQKFDLIVSNPPYIDANDPHLELGDVRFEPKSALVAANQGLSDIETIITKATGYLKPRGWLLIEHGWTQGAAVRELMQSAQFNAVTSIRDYANLERVTVGQWSNANGQ